MGWERSVHDFMPVQAATGPYNSNAQVFDMVQCVCGGGVGVCVCVYVCGCVWVCAEDV